MAVGARARTASTYGIAITGIAGPAGGTEQKPVGLVYVAVADAAGALVVNRQFLADRQRVRVFTTQMALDLLRRRLTGLA
jgi:nicotinamide-nucleotide amidase